MNSHDWSISSIWERPPVPSPSPASMTSGGGGRRHGGAAPKRFVGLAVGSGLAIGPVIALDPRTPGQTVRSIEPNQVDSEIQRLAQALTEAARATSDAVNEARDRLGTQYADILRVHASMIADPSLQREAEEVIRSQTIDAAGAVVQVLRRHAERLRALGTSNPYLAARAADLLDIEQRILDQLAGTESAQIRPWEIFDEPVLILAHDLSPSETARLDPRRVLGFATEAGGVSSHTAIVAAALGLPAVVGLGPFLDQVPLCGEAILDGDDGILILNPDEATRDQARRLAHKRARRRRVADRQAILPALTCDKVAVSILGNIEFPEEADDCRERGAEGIGLFRSEFLFLNAPHPPDEEAQFQAYARVVRALEGRPVTIRTLDLGADKSPVARVNGLQRHRVEEVNPCLGLRSLRRSLRDPEEFKLQLRAVLRAARLGDVRILFPMVTTLSEFRQARALVVQAAEELRARGDTPPDPLPPLGAMIEVPSAALIADKLAREADFLSIGTNDLVQYTLAVDRANPLVADLSSGLDPSVLRLIALVVAAAREHDTELTVCGAMGGDPKSVLVLLGLGLRSLSMPPQRIGVIKDLVRRVRMSDLEALAHQARNLDLASEVESLLRETLVRDVFENECEGDEESGELATSSLVTDHASPSPSTRLSTTSPQPEANESP